MHNSRSTYLAAQAKKFVEECANRFDDPEFLVKRREVLGLTAAQQTRLYGMIERVAEPLRKAFESTDEWERDWFLLWARSAAAMDTAPMGIGRIPGTIPIPRDSAIDRKIAYVQKHLADKMVMCKNQQCEEPCFFRTRKQQYCPDCKKEANRATKRRSWAKHGKVWRPPKST